MVKMADSRASPLLALLVENDPADAELIAMRLACSRHSCSRDPADGGSVQLWYAGSAAAACAALRDAPVDVVILDLSLPDARGLEALHRVRGASTVPVIVLTDSADQQLALAALRAGARDYVLKPPPDGRTLFRILHFARERQRLVRERDAAIRESATAAVRWRLLAQAGEALAAAGDLHAALAEVTTLLVPDAADCVLLLLASAEEMPLCLEVTHANAARGAELRDQLARRLATDAPSIARMREALQPVLASLGGARATVVPVHGGGRARGLLVLAERAGSDDAVTDVELARSLADRIGLALERARLLHQMQHAVAARDRAISIMSHDLRDPLNTIQVCASALLDPDPAPAYDVRQTARLIQRSAAWMQQIVHDLLDRASLETGRLALHRRPTAVSDLMGAAQGLFAPVATEQDIQFTAHSASDLPQVDADPDRVLQVLSNLIGNAMKFTPAGGRVDVSARATEGPRAADGRGTVRFSVSDTGPGIRPEDLAHVFDWFWQSPRAAHSGAGLGLAIAKGLVEAHRGQLNVESVPGHGSTFWFTLDEANTPATARGDAEVRLS
jgi:signal transduction histidine kinase/DNA-binding response OmpR family regulator